MSEIWKPIPNYEGLYEASSLGRIRSVYRYNRILKPMISNSGYARVDLFKNKNRKQFSVHRLIAMTFISNPEGKKAVNHIDENKLNNCIDNLEWVTHKENCNFGTAIKRRLMHTDYDMRDRSWQTAEHYEQVSITMSQPVICVETGKVYRNCRAASEDTGYPARSISRWINGKKQKAGKLTFRKYERGNDLSHALLE